MINLRYHIVSLTAVFLAIGIGLTLGSTFLDRATVDNLNGQLENLESRLADRETRVNELEERLERDQATVAALDEQALGLLDGRLRGVPVVIVTSRGADEDDVAGSRDALVAAGADLQGILWFTDRFVLDDDAEVADLAEVLGESSDDPARLRRMAIDGLGGELRALQSFPPPDGEADGETDDETDGADAGTEPSAPTAGDDDPDGTEDPAAADDPAGTDSPPVGGIPDPAPVGPTPLLTSLVERGFVDFEPPPGGPELPELREGTRTLLAGGSSDVPDDLVLGPLVERMTRAARTPLLGVAGSARVEDGEVSDLISVIREDEQVRELVPTVDHLEHFDGWAAMVLAMAEVAEGVVGHYGTGEGASRLLPPLTTP